MSQLPYLVPGWILLVGVYGMVTSRNLVHAVVCLSVAQSATYVLLLTIGYRRKVRGVPVLCPDPSGASMRWRPHRVVLAVGRASDPQGSPGSQVGCL